MPDSTHACPAKGCDKTVPFERLACSRHWYSLPYPLRRQITTAWVKGDLEAHSRLRAEAVGWWEAQAGA